MPRLIVTTREGATREIDVRAGQSVMEALRGAGVGDVLALCGGCCSCATCHVLIAPEWIEATGAAGTEEHDLLGCSPSYTIFSRLSCQIPVTPALDGLHLTIAPED